MADETPESQGQGPGLIVLDADPAERERLEGMADELGVDVWAVTPEDLVPERSDAWESLAQARAVVVTAQFGPRSGLEIIEGLVWRNGARPQVTALGLDRPHRAWIEAALRAGATTCVVHPFELEELKVKVVEPIAREGDVPETTDDEETDDAAPTDASEEAS